MSHEIIYQLFGSDVLTSITAFNSTLRAEFALCATLIQENKLLFREFQKKGIFSWDHFIVRIQNSFDF